MKRITAEKHLCTIIHRLRVNDGVFYTPRTTHPRVIIEKAWVFGSYIKGSENPNDLDILVDYKEVGEVNPLYIFERKFAYERFIMDIRRRMKMVRIHDNQTDGEYKDIPHTKQLIFARSHHNLKY